MIVGRLLSPIHSLGPGHRVGLWTRGCGKKCPGCVSPELQPFVGEDIPETALYHILRQLRRKGQCTGLTISGGDPFEQPSALLALLRLVRQEFEDILVYTGFTLQELRDGAAGADGIACLALIDVLIDGRYLQQLNRPDCVLRGSENQTIHFLNPAPEPDYRAYMARGRILETFDHNGDIIITGILNKEESP